VDGKTENAEVSIIHVRFIVQTALTLSFPAFCTLYQMANYVAAGLITNAKAEPADLRPPKIDDLTIACCVEQNPRFASS